MGQIIDSIAKQGAFFDVYQDVVKTGKGKIVEGRMAICRKDNDLPVGIVSKKYNMITTEQIFTRFDVALTKSKIDLEGATAAVTFANGGARTMVHMRFPSHEISLRGDDRSILEIVTKQSYDGRWKFSTRGGALRYACLNGMLLGDWAATYSEYHNKNLDVNLAASKIATILSSFDGTQARWQRMIKSSVTDEKAWRVFCLFSDRKADFKSGISAQKNATRANAATKMFAHWLKNEKKDIGQNAFGLYNALTHHSTHAKLREGKEAIGLDLRINKVSTILESKYWNERVLTAA